MSMRLLIFSRAFSSLVLREAAMVWSRRAACSSPMSDAMFSCTLSARDGSTSTFCSREQNSLSWLWFLMIRRHAACASSRCPPESRAARMTRRDMASTHPKQSPSAMACLHMSA